MTVLNTNLAGIQFNLRSNGLQSEEIVSAVHEAAHAVVAMAVGAEVDEILVQCANNGRCSYTGRCAYSWHGDQDTPTNSAMITAAGIAAMDFVDPAIVSIGGDSRDRPVDSDARKMAEHYREYVDDEPSTTDTLDDFWQGSRRAARHILQTYRYELEALAAAVLHKRELNAADVRAAVGPLASSWQVMAPARTASRSMPTPSPLTRGEMITALEAINATPRTALPDRVQTLLSDLEAVVTPRPVAPSYRVGPGPLRFGDAVMMETR